MSISIQDLEAQFSLATHAIHVDDRYAGPDLAPAIHPSTTFRYSYNPDELEPQQALSVCYYPHSAKLELSAIFLEKSANEYFGS